MCKVIFVIEIETHSTLSIIKGGPRSYNKKGKRMKELLEKMVATPDKVTEAEMKSLKDDVDKLKQEAENRIAKLPREERELKLSLIRGDKVSDKTFKEMKDTAIGLSGSLQNYISEVRKIPVGSVAAINNQVVETGQKQIQLVDPDEIDMGDA